MQAVVLAGGQGKRLQPLTQNIPKPLVTVDGKPLLQYVLEVLVPHVEEFIIVTGYKGEKIRERFGKTYKNIPITYVEQKERLGTGHALMLCKKNIRDSFILMYADEIVDKDAVTQLIQHPAAALAFRSDTPENFGVFTVSKTMLLTDVEEKPVSPKSDLVSAAAFKLTTDIFNHYPPPEKRGEYYLSDMLPNYLKEQPMYVVVARYWFTINRPEDVEIVESALRKTVSE